MTRGQVWTDIGDFYLVLGLAHQLETRCRGGKGAIFILKCLEAKSNRPGHQKRKYAENVHAEMAAAAPSRALSFLEASFQHFQFCGMR